LYYLFGCFTLYANFCEITLQFWLNTKEFYTFTGECAFKLRKELTIPFFGDARFPAPLDSSILMKLSGFGDYERRARWSELPSGCFNNRNKFNIDGRRINNSRITSDIFTCPLSVWKEPDVEARLWSFGESSLARETFIMIFH